MILKQPRKILFQYAAQNHKGEPININFSFDEKDTYLEDLKLFALLLHDALKDIEIEKTEQEKK